MGLSPIRGAARTIVLAAALAGCGGWDRSAGEIAGEARDPQQVARAQLRQTEAAASLAVASPQQILFGDLHVHSTFSIDAFVFALPLFAGEGVHPPADACDFARYCSGLDFFSINDHAEGLTPSRWRETIDSIRSCNERAGGAASPDLVAFMGYEWTQVGATPENHFGHKNVVFRDLDDDSLPARPVTSLEDGVTNRARAMGLVRALQFLPLGGYGDFLWWVEQLSALPDCERGIDSTALPADCRENALTPEALFEKLAQWGVPHLVIPHGLAWGVHAPPGARIDNQLRPDRLAPQVQRLLEVYSGHGNSESWRDFPEDARNDAGEPVCPEPSADYLPCCWRAGELVRARCGDASDEECEARVQEARRLARAARGEPHLVLPDTRPEDWLDCDQCRDCFKPAMNLRPGETAQYAAAVSRPDPSGGSRRFRFGYIASTDNHAARPGTGYKQYARRVMTDARGMGSRIADGLTRPFIIGRQRNADRAQPAPDEVRGLRGMLDVERTASFMYPGGLVAVHAEGRERHAIWDALMARRVYGTSGPRILLWFDLLSVAGGRLPMGAETAQAGPPRFEVKAVGAWKQRPGCPEESLAALEPERLAHLCRDECYHPGDERHPIRAIEVIRIRPQRHAGEPVAGLIEDPWRRFECPSDPSGCVVRFDDPDFAASGRDAVYYVRALQEETPAVNGANLRTRFDADGNALSVEPCHGSYLTPAEDDCLAPAAERAWSSPIYVDWVPER